MKAFILLVIFAASVIAQTPTPPTWPTAFSASMERRRMDPFHHRMRNDFFRWFYDSNQNMERFDGPHMWHNEFIFGISIINYNTDVLTSIFMQDDIVTCVLRTVNWTIPEPNFSSFTFVGTSVVGLRVANYFIDEDQRGDWWNLWTDQQTNKIIRVNVATPDFGEETWTFHEFDIGAQDSGLFVVPDLVAGNCFSA